MPRKQQQMLLMKPLPNISPEGHRLGTTGQQTDKRSVAEPLFKPQMVLDLLSGPVVILMPTRPIYAALHEEARQQHITLEELLDRMLRLLVAKGLSALAAAPDRNASE